MPDFKAQSRFPVRPLSYENKDLAVNRELIVDYTNGAIYVKDDNGEIHDITQAVSDIISEEVQSDPTMITENIKINVPDTDPEAEPGSTVEVAIDDAVKWAIEWIETNGDVDEQQHQDIETLKTDVTTLQGKVQTLEDANVEERIDALAAILKDDGAGNLSVEVKPADIQLDANHRFVTDTQLSAIGTIGNKTETKYYKVTVAANAWTGSTAPFSATITGLTWAAANMNPPIMDLVASTYYATAEKEIAGYQIYKATTAANSITLYNNVKPEVALTLLFEVKTPYSAVVG